MIEYNSDSETRNQINSLKELIHRMDISEDAIKKISTESNRKELIKISESIRVSATRIIYYLKQVNGATSREFQEEEHWLFLSIKHFVDILENVEQTEEEIRNEAGIDEEHVINLDEIMKESLLITKSTITH